LFRIPITVPFVIIFFEYYTTLNRWDICQDGIAVCLFTPNSAYKDFEVYKLYYYQEPNFVEDYCSVHEAFYIFACFFIGSNIQAN